MNKITLLCILLLASLLPGAASAYGGGSGKRSCKAPQFSQLSPAAKAVVSSQATISFIASNTRATSISVSAKGLEIPVTVTEQRGDRLKVTGRLPAALVGFARIMVQAESPTGCAKKEGWLIKIEPNRGD